MFKKILGTTTMLVMLIGLCISLAPGQAGFTQIEGTVKVRGADGKAVPVPNAQVDIYRTDIKGHWDAKTDKNGHYIRLGMAFVGLYFIIVSAPGIQPTWVNGVRLNASSTVDIETKPGDGSKLTLEQAQAQASGQAASGSGGGGQKPPQMTAEQKAKAEEAAKAEAKGKELQGSFDQARAHYNQGVELKKNKNIEAALSEFEQAASVDTAAHPAFIELAHKANANVAEIQYQMGVTLFNSKKRDEAKPHFETAVATIEKAIELAGKDKNPNINNDIIVYYDILSKNLKLLVENYGDMARLDEGLKTVEKAEALDPASKKKWEMFKADLYRGAGKTDEAVAAYKGVLDVDPTNADALYWMGLTLVATADKVKMQEGANILADFVSKAPSTDTRVPEVKLALEAIKNEYKVEAEKPSKRKKP